MTEYSPTKTGEYPRIFPSFQNRLCYEKYLKDNKDNSLNLTLKYARIFVLGHYLFLEAHSFPRASLSENCSLLGTDNVRGQISAHIFAPNGGYCLFIIDYFCLHDRNHEWFRKDLPVYLFPSSTLESDIVDQECLALVCEVSV